MGTRGGGISVFDGFEFRNYTTQDGLAGNYIHEILEDRNGIIWVATANGLCYFQHNTFHELPSPATRKPGTILDIALSENGTLYAAGSSGVYRIAQQKYILLAEPSDLEGASPTCVAICNKQLLIGTDRALFSWDQGKVRNLGEESDYMHNAITTIENDGKGTCWIGTYGDGMYAYRDQRFFRIDYHLELYRQTVLDIFADHQSNLWIATLSKGVIHYDRNTKLFTQISEAEGLSNNHVRSIFEDRNHSLWFGTSGGGVCHYLGKQFTSFDERSGLGGNYIYSVFRNTDGTLWIGNSQRGVTTLSDAGFTHYDANNAFRNVKVKSMTGTPDGTVWLGTDGQGVYFARDGKFAEIEELRSAYVRQMKTDAQGHVWIATAGNGLIEVTPRTGSTLIEKWTVADGLRSNRITCLYFDAQGTLWYGTERDGIGAYITAKHKNRPSVSADLAGVEIRSMAEDAGGRIWIGTAGQGVAVLDPSTGNILRRFTENDGLHSGNVYLLQADNSGNIIVGTEKGLDHIYLSAQGTIRQIRHYGQADGFTGVETCQNASWGDADGTLWFGTIHGLNRFSPSEMMLNQQAPVLSLRDIRIFYKSILDEYPVLKDGTQSGPLTLGYQQNHISFDFLGINLKRPEGVTYQWRLVGFDDRWSPPSRDRSILYSNLNPGKYRFEVKACNEDNVWSSVPLVFDFEIAAPFWQQAWFRWLIILGTIALLVAAYLLSVRRIRRKAGIRQQQLAFEKDLLELEHKAMRLQMNPHFIFNALNSIQSLIGTGKETEARYYLAKFSRLMRQILDNSRKTAISLEEEIHTLENYLLIEQFCNGDRFSYSLDVDESLETDFINIPPMLIQPFVENAIKHGMKGREEGNDPGRIDIRFREVQGILECTVEDNGVGREASAKLRETSKETYHTSAGLSVTTERLSLLKTDSDFEPLEITDLYTDGKPSGTRVIIRIPID